MGGHESPFKGRYFDDVVYYFVKYKVRCNAPEATLIRTTPKNPFNIFAWPSYLFNPKWKLEYREPTDFPGGYYAKIWDCYNKSILMEEWKMSQARHEFIKNLKMSKRPSPFSRLWKWKQDRGMIWDFRFNPLNRRWGDWRSLSNYLSKSSVSQFRHLDRSFLSRR